MKLFVYLFYILNLRLREEYECKIKDDNILDMVIIEKARKNLELKYNDIFKSLYLFKSVGAYLNREISKKEEYLREMKDHINQMSNVLFSVINLKFDKHLIKLILSIKLDSKERMSNYVVCSIFTTILIQNFIIVSSYEQKITDYVDVWKDFMENILDKDLLYNFIYNIYSIDYLDNKDSIIKKDAVKFLILQHRINFLSALKVVVLEDSEKNKLISFRTSYYNAINERMDYLRDPGDKSYYFLFNHQGFRHNRISNSNLIDLYKKNCYKTFLHYDEYFETYFINEDIDISYIKDKVFKFQKKEEFEYTMGLLQYISCRYKKHIICILKRYSYDIEIINVSNPPIDLILDCYQRKNNITQEVRNNLTKYNDKYFISIIKGQEYRFTGRDKDKIVLSRCLVLSCSHIIGNELLEEYFSNFLSKCHLCNIDFEIKAYFEAYLYTA